MRLITPKTARKSPRILTSCASHSRLKPEIFRTSRSERGTGEPAAVADTLGPPRKRLIPNQSRIRPANLHAGCFLNEGTKAAGMDPWGRLVLKNDQGSQHRRSNLTNGLRGLDANPIDHAT